MQRRLDSSDGAGGGQRSVDGGERMIMGASGARHGCYGIQILIAGRQKRWRDDVTAQVRRAGYASMAVDSAVDALTVLVLGLPCDVLVTDLDLHGDLCGTRLADEARALRPKIGIIFADSLPPTIHGGPSARADAPDGAREAVLTSTVRAALCARAA